MKEKKKKNQNTKKKVFCYFHFGGENIAYQFVNKIWFYFWNINEESIDNIPRFCLDFLEFGLSISGLPIELLVSSSAKNDKYLLYILHLAFKTGIKILKLDLSPIELSPLQNLGTVSHLNQSLGAY